MSAERSTPSKRIYAGYSDEALRRAITDYREYVKEQRGLLDDLRGALRLLRDEAAVRKRERVTRR